MKKIYEYSPVTKEYTGQTSATPIPDNPGQYFERVNATFVPPPETNEKEIAVWMDDKWETRPDYRDITYYIRGADDQIEAVKISEIGVTIPADAYLSADAVPKTRAEKEVEVRIERDARLALADVLINKSADAGNDTTLLRAYRQALRDVPSQARFPDHIVWPEIPA